MKKLYQVLASTIQARLNCIEKCNHEWEEKHLQTIYSLQDKLPHGSGFDCGTKVDLEKSTGEKIVLNTSFHHMNDGGYYDGWTDHTILVTPSLHLNFNLKISGKDKNQIKEYMYDCFSCALSEEI